MIKAAQTFAGSAVTGLRVQHVDVVIALTGLTCPTHFPGVSIVTRCALITSSTCREEMAVQTSDETLRV